MMIKRKLIRKAAVSVMTAACVVSQAGTTCAAEAGRILTQGTWKNENGKWKHYDAYGKTNTGWIQTGSGWYYLSPEDGTMLTGWQKIEGKYFYLNTAADGIEGLMRTGWYQDANGRWYFLNTVHDGTYGAMCIGWHWIDGYQYYFEEKEGPEQGRMYAGETAPNGYQVDDQGRCLNSDGSVLYEAGRGMKSVETSTAVNTGSSSSGSGGSSSGGSGG
ncbi:MAG: hypothetical protein Q4E86_14420, partial [Lachnospiraceae bacterium]|nr:hypothetical protein [Lachnospiraceae bacterium]